MPPKKPEPTQPNFVVLSDADKRAAVVGRLSQTEREAYDLFLQIQVGQAQIDAGADPTDLAPILEEQQATLTQKEAQMTVLQDQLAILPEPEIPAPLAAPELPVHPLLVAKQPVGVAPPPANLEHHLTEPEPDFAGSVPPPA